MKVVRSQTVSVPYRGKLHRVRWEFVDGLRRERNAHGMYYSENGKRRTIQIDVCDPVPKQRRTGVHEIVHLWQDITGRKLSEFEAETLEEFIAVGMRAMGGL